MVDSILISRDAIAAVLAEREQKRRTRSDLDRELELIDRKVDAMRVLAPQFFPDERLPSQVLFDEIVTKAVDDNTKQRTVIDAVVKAVRDAPGSLTPKGIRQAIIDQGDGSLMTNENYLYTAIKRAADQDRITRDQKGGYYAL